MNTLAIRQLILEDNRIKKLVLKRLILVVMNNLSKKEDITEMSKKKVYFYI